MSKHTSFLARLVFVTALIVLSPVSIAAAQDDAVQDTPSASAPASAAATPSATDYVLGVGDKLRVTVFNEADLSGEYQVNAMGVVSMPLIGEVEAAHKTVSQVQATIASKLSQGYMKNPHVSLEVLSYRPFFIVGEVMKPGSYNYVNGMTVINAVAVAGGYTYRASKSEITLKHSTSGPNAKEEPVTETTTVMPGDVINVPERFF